MRDELCEHRIRHGGGAGRTIFQADIQVNSSFVCIIDGDLLRASDVLPAVVLELFRVGQDAPALIPVGIRAGIAQLIGAAWFDSDCS